MTRAGRAERHVHARRSAGVLAVSSIDRLPALAQIRLADVNRVMDVSRASSERPYLCVVTAKNGRVERLPVVEEIFVIDRRARGQLA